MTNEIRPILNITRRACPAQKFAKYARVVFPEGVTRSAVEATIGRFPASEGFRVSLRRSGPVGFSLPLELAELGA
ncbi:MAG: hypothetical protein LCH89_00410 [Proteobacteria bacterium]|nr:hypothetical protein [Pseudomonadota bacterium]